MDIRLVRGRTQRLWLWTGVLVGLAGLAYLAGVVFGDPTSQAGRASGANANFGAERGAVVPMRPSPFENALPLEDRELGRLLRVRGTVQSRMASGTIWVRTTAGRWILMRFEPLPADGSAGRFGHGSAVDVIGYLERISRAEFDAWMDSLAVYLPRPRPGVKFGDLPDSGFIRVDSLFIRDYYISVRPEGASRRVAETAPPAAGPVPTTPVLELAPARESVPRPATERRAQPAERPEPVRRPPPPEAEPNDTRPSIPVPQPVMNPNAPRDTLRVP